MIDKKEKIYQEQKSLPGSESSMSPQDSSENSDIDSKINSDICSNDYDDEIINYDEIGFDDSDYTTDYFDPTNEEIDVEIEIADLLNRIDNDCINLLDKDN